MHDDAPSFDIQFIEKQFGCGWVIADTSWMTLTQQRDLIRQLITPLSQSSDVNLSILKLIPDVELDAPRAYSLDPCRSSSRSFLPASSIEA